MSGGNYSDLMQDYKSLRVGLAVVICATLENTHDTYREGQLLTAFTSSSAN